MTRIRHLARLFLPFLSLQALVQVVSAVAGIAVVRQLPVNDFAVYAIAASVQASLAMLSDVGISNVLLARAGAFHADLGRVAILARTARAFRHRLLIWCLVIAGPLLWFSLGQSRPPLLPWVMTLALVCAIVAVQVSTSLDSTLLLSLLRAERQQLGYLVNAGVRLAGFVALLGLFPSFVVALAINLLAVGIQAALYRADLRNALPPADRENDEDRGAFRQFARTQILNATYYAFSSQITLWIVGFVGTARVVAEVGALGRLSSIIVLAQSAVLALVAPRVARYREPRLFWRRYFQVTGFALIASAALIALALLAPKPLLFVIGPKYSGLEKVLPLAVGASVTYTLAMTLFSLNSARAWFHYTWLSAPLTIVTQIACLKLLDVSTVRGALLFGWASAAPALVLNMVISWIGHRRSLITPVTPVT